MPIKYIYNLTAFILGIVITSYIIMPPAHARRAVQLIGQLEVTNDKR